MLGPRHVRRLARAKELLAAKGFDTRETKLACYSGVGFEPELRDNPGDNVVLVPLERLYEG